MKKKKKHPLSTVGPQACFNAGKEICVNPAFVTQHAPWGSPPVFLLPHHVGVYNPRQCTAHLVVTCVASLMVFPALTTPLLLLLPKPQTNTLTQISAPSVCRGPACVAKLCICIHPATHKHTYTQTYTSECSHPVSQWETEAGGERMDANSVYRAVCEGRNMSSGINLTKWACVV